jgi:hypothetical protein
MSVIAVPALKSDCFQSQVADGIPGITSSADKQSNADLSMFLAPSGRPAGGASNINGRWRTNSGA